jgi:hypothetical protein
MFMRLPLVNRSARTRRCFSAYHGGEAIDLVDARFGDLVEVRAVGTAT